MGRTRAHYQGSIGMETANVISVDKYCQIKAAVINGLRREGVNLEWDELEGPVREHRLTSARQLCAFIMREHLRIGIENIGERLNRHHTSVVYQEKKAIIGIENEAWMGRAYMYAIGELGFTAPPWLHPKLITPVTEKPVAKITQRNIVKEFKKDDGYIEPLMWKPEEKAVLDEWRKRYKYGDGSQRTR